jgi:hypothetical protein
VSGEVVRTKKKENKIEMKSFTIIFVVFFVVCVAFASTQWNNQNNGQQFPNFMPDYNELCKQPGANCQSVSQVCDSRGNCKTVKNASSFAATGSVLLISVCALLRTYL